MSSVNRTARGKVNGLVLGTTENAAAQLRRLTMACMLWEDQFYLDGTGHTTVLAKAVKACDPAVAKDIALEARSKFKLRHVPLLIMRELARVGGLKADALADVIQRPDEIGEFISMYWKDGKQPLSNQVKKGLAKSFNKFSEYQFAKWDKNSAAVKLRDALFLVHAKPSDAAQADLFKRIAEDTLKTPDTWEVELSGGADKKETFTRLMGERKLGAMAFIRNLRNMEQAGVSRNLIESYGETVNTDRVLPFRFLAAAKMVPSYKAMLEVMMLRSLKLHERIAGKTVLLVDVSGSMFGPKVSAKSDIDRFEAAASLAILAREVCEQAEIYTFSNSLARIPSGVRGFALLDALMHSQGHHGTDTTKAVNYINAEVKYDRIILFTDEQTTSAYRTIPAPKGKGFVINVASYDKGLTTTGDWTTVSGFSEAVVDFIQEYEKS